MGNSARAVRMADVMTGRLRYATERGGTAPGDDPTRRNNVYRTGSAVPASVVFQPVGVIGDPVGREPLNGRDQSDGVNAVMNGFDGEKGLPLVAGNGEWGREQLRVAPPEDRSSC
jgi:hypothetical protein